MEYEDIKLYLQAGKYPDKSSKKEKYVIRRRAKQFRQVNGKTELFYRPAGAHELQDLKQVGMLYVLITPCWACCDLS